MIDVMPLVRRTALATVLSLVRMNAKQPVVHNVLIVAKIIVKKDA